MWESIEGVIRVNRSGDRILADKIIFGKEIVNAMNYEWDSERMCQSEVVQDQGVGGLSSFLLFPPSILSFQSEMESTRKRKSKEKSYFLFVSLEELKPRISSLNGVLNNPERKKRIYCDLDWTTKADFLCSLLKIEDGQYQVGSQSKMNMEQNSHGLLACTISLALHRWLAPDAFSRKSF